MFLNNIPKRRRNEGFKLLHLVLWDQYVRSYLKKPSKNDSTNWLMPWFTFEYLLPCFLLVTISLLQGLSVLQELLKWVTKKIIFYKWWCPTLSQSNDLTWFTPTCDPCRAGYGKQSRFGICEKSTCCRPKGCSDGKSVFETTQEVDWSEKEEERSLGCKTFHYLLHNK